MIVHERTRLGDMFGIGSMTPRGIVYSQKPDEWGTDTASDYPIGQVSAGVRFLDIPDSIQLGRFAGGSSQSRQFKTAWPPWATAYARRGGILRVLPPEPMTTNGMSGCCAGCVGGNHCEGGLGDLNLGTMTLPVVGDVQTSTVLLSLAAFYVYQRVMSGAQKIGRKLRRRRRPVETAA